MAEIYTGRQGSIRQATLADLPAIMDIENRAFRGNLIEDEAVFRDRLAVFAPGFRLLEHEGSPFPIGYVSSEIWTYQEVPQRSNFELGHDIQAIHQPEGQELYVSSMGLLPEYRGKGLGSRLIEDLLEQPPSQNRELDSALLMVGASWMAARSIYTKLGFLEIGRYQDFLKIGSGQTESVILMRRLFR